MPPESSTPEVPVVLASSPVAGAGARPADGTLALPRIAPFGARRILPRVRVAVNPLAARLALGTILLGTFVIVLLATAGPSVLVPRSGMEFPRWESGPLHGLFGRLINDGDTLNWALTIVLVAMLAAYGMVLAAFRFLSMRTIVICVLALHAILLLSPPQQLTDVFNYLGYARLGGLHHLNPYTNVINQELHDPIYRFTTWHNLHSPYGPLFTAMTYPLAFVSLPLAYWTLKVSVVLASLGFIALVWKCARLLGRDPRFVVLFVAANPVFLMYGLSGFHNDFFLLVPSMAAITLLLARKDKAAGAILMVAVAVKFTAILLLPFLLLGAAPSRRRLQVLAGAALATIPLAALSVALFGFSLPNLSDQSTLLTDFSIPNVFGWVIGIGGGAPGLLRVANVALVLVVVFLIRRRTDWLVGAGWATFALIASLAWLVPWYVIWLLPLAALAGSLRLRGAALALTAYLLIAFMPETGIFLYTHGLDPMGSSVGQASTALQHKLSQ